MKTDFSFKPFASYVKFNSLPGTRNRAAEIDVKQLLITEKGTVRTTVIGKSVHQVEIRTTLDKILSAECDCSYKGFGSCEHILRTIDESDEKIAAFYRNIVEREEVVAVREPDFSWLIPDVHWQTLENTEVKDLTGTIHLHNEMRWSSDWEEIEIQQHRITGIFDFLGSYFAVELIDDHEGIHLSCSCRNKSDVLCQHLALILRNRKDEVYRAAFDTDFRFAALNKAARHYGVSVEEQELSEIFVFRYKRGTVVVEPKVNLVHYSKLELDETVGELLKLPPLPWEKNEPATKRILVVSADFHSILPRFVLAEALLTKNGELKAPVKVVDTAKVIATANDKTEFEFLRSLSALNLGVRRYQNPAPFEEIFDSYKFIFREGKSLDAFFFDDDGGKITPSKLLPATLEMIQPDIRIQVDEKNDFMVVSCLINIHGELKNTSELVILDHCLLREKNKLTFLNSLIGSKMIDYFHNEGDILYIQKSQFEKFKVGFLDKVEAKIPVHYRIGKKQKSSLPKPRKVVVDNAEKRIVLSESDSYILLQPTVVYGDVEIPLYSTRALYEEMPDGSRAERERNVWLENGFSKFMERLHPTFAENPEYEFHYLTRQEFLHDGWFLDAFEKMREEDIQIFGFNQLSNNRMNGNRPKITAHLSSGIDWFAVAPEIKFGDQLVALEELQKAVVKQSRLVQLGDGTEGMLPQEWLDKFSAFFRSAELKDGVFKAKSAQFQLIDDLFRDAHLEGDYPELLQRMNRKFSEFESIADVRVPKLLKTELRDYQKEGLNWLSFLDEFGFGGCLADDMGLGKTVQMIAFMLLQHEKGEAGCNLVVAPTSLIFNWEQEIVKFAPHLRVGKHVGGSRIDLNAEQNNFDVLLTTYGIMMRDVALLKEVNFNLIVLDESQAIKNPDSKRYKAASLLKGRRRIAMTGTPIENNTFDLYAQLSFAMPGLLGTQRFFREVYSTPVDKFQSTDRAEELHRKVHPFILRRTKKQVAKELPEKTEMVIFCEMSPRQKQLYTVYKKKIEDILKSPEYSSGQKSGALLSGLTKLRQICNSPATLADSGDYGDDSSKLEELMLQIEEKQSEHKMIVFSQFVSMLDLVREKLDVAGIPYCVLTGISKDRQESVERFQNDDSVRVFLISLKAGGLGLNLTQADYVFLLDPWWNPAAENQAIDRAYRIGQEKHVVAVRFITPDTIEEKVMELQERKRSVATEIIRTDQNILKSLSKEELLEML